MKNGHLMSTPQHAPKTSQVIVLVVHVLRAGLLLYLGSTMDSDSSSRLCKGHRQGYNTLHY